MANRKGDERGVRKLKKIGAGSIGMTLPIDMVRDLGWREKQKVVVTRVRGGLLIRDWRRR